jgi:hypothetical protein
MDGFGLPEQQVYCQPHEIEAALQQNNVRLLCIDFDQTLVRMHTNGCYEGPVDELAQSVRQLFAELIQIAVSAGTAVSIVTFSPQAQLIREVLHRVLPPGITEQVLLRTTDPAESWSAVAGLPARGSGKLHHMASSWEAAGLGPGRSCEWGSVLLIDDDRRNVERAVEWGARTAWFRPDVAGAEQLLLDDLRSGETPLHRGRPLHPAQNPYERMNGRGWSALSRLTPWCSSGSAARPAAAAVAVQRDVLRDTATDAAQAAECAELNTKQSQPKPLAPRACLLDATLALDAGRPMRFSNATRCATAPPPPWL